MSEVVYRSHVRIELVLNRGRKTTELVFEALPA
jgi:hypothetical protein